MTTQQRSTASCFDGIYSDWFKLQTVRLMTFNPNGPGWYLSRNSSTASLAPLYLASARKSFYLQTAGEYFGMQYITQVPAYFPNNPAHALLPQQWPTPDALNGCLLKFIIGNNATADNWWYRDSTPGSYVWFSARAGSVPSKPA